MGCFSCIRPSKKNVKDYNGGDIDTNSTVGGRRKANVNGNVSMKKGGSGRAKGKDGNNPSKGNAAHSFTFKDLALATQNFRESNLIGGEGFGSVYKGHLESGLAVAVKQLNLEGLQGNQEFIVEVLMLSLLHHPNLVNLIGYCTDGDQRLLVYEFMQMGSLENHLFEPTQMPLSWSTRMKIAVDAARGIEYLHCKVNPPVIYRNLKSSNILLDNDFNAKLSDFGLAKLGLVGENTHVSTRMMGTYGYCAPEYAMSGKLTLKSDIYSFGVVLLELITGRMAIDPTKPPGEQNLVKWSRPYLKDPRRHVQMVDPLLEGQFSVRCLHHAVAVTAMCLQEQANFRPLISDIVLALEFLASQPDDSRRGMSHSRTSPSPLHVDAKKADLRRHGCVEAPASSTAENFRLQTSSPRARTTEKRASRCSRCCFLWQPLHI